MYHQIGHTSGSLSLRAPFSAVVIVSDILACAIFIAGNGSSSLSFSLKDLQLLPIPDGTPDTPGGSGVEVGSFSFLMEAANVK
jgi:hypothetical protein